MFDNNGDAFRSRSLGRKQTNHPAINVPKAKRAVSEVV